LAYYTHASGINSSGLAYVVSGKRWAQEGFEGTNYDANFL
jgi:hypothetical protein